MFRATQRLRPILAASAGGGALAGGAWVARCDDGASSSGRWTWPAGAASGSTLQAAVATAEEGTQFEHRVPCDTVQTGSFGFLIYLPEGYSKGGPWPVVFHLHGGGENENQAGFGPLTKDGVNLLSAAGGHGLPAIIESVKHPYVLVSPQCPQGSRGWGGEPALAACKQLADQLTSELNVDTSRFYLTGLSMGGSGTWQWAHAEPERFAALAPICGGWRDQATRASAAEKVSHLPHWVAHGANDKIANVSGSDKMVEALKEAGAPTVVYKRESMSCLRASCASAVLF